MTWISTWKGSKLVFPCTWVSPTLSCGGEVESTSSDTNQKQSKPYSSDQPWRFLVLGRNGEASGKHTHGQDVGQWTLVIHPSTGVRGPVLLIWGGCQEPPMYTELMEGLSSKGKVIIPDFLI